MAGIGRIVAALGGRVPPFADPRAPDTRPLLQNHAEQDWRDVVARMEVPSLHLAGRESQFWPYQHATASAESNKLAQAVVIDDCGHAANIDQPDLVNAAILEFLR
jgi:pimeloyl-ACP methyl ester carboxylesterase